MKDNVVLSLRFFPRGSGSHQEAHIISPVLMAKHVVELYSSLLVDGNTF
ncbi:hypothetical protein [Candidatus Liberibacter solanacearum]|nr:hypothetical protein [Candidatus Liberibacter solanacearum]